MFPRQTFVVLGFLSLAPAVQAQGGLSDMFRSVTGALRGQPCLALQDPSPRRGTCRRRRRCAGKAGGCDAWLRSPSGTRLPQLSSEKTRVVGPSIAANRPPPQAGMRTPVFLRMRLLNSVS